MSPDKLSSRTGEKFYGWYSLAGAMLVIMVAGGIFVHTFGVFLPVICNEFGWSRAAVSVAMSLGFLAFGLPSPLTGSFIARFGPRKAIIIGNFIAALAVAALSLVQETWHIYLLYIIIGLSSGFGGHIAGTTVANNWFIKKRSLALGMFMGFGGVGGFIFPPLATALIAAVGWRDSWLIMSVIFMVLTVLLAGVVLVRNKPEDMGQVPDGVADDAFLSVDEMNALSGMAVEQGEWSIKQVLKEPVIWLMVVFVAANAFALGTMTTHQIAHLLDIGYSPMTSATTLSMLSAFSIVGSIGFGALAIRYNMKKIAVISFIFQILSLVILLVTRELFFIYVYTVFMGGSIGALMTAMPALAGEYYRREKYAQIMGIILPFQVVSQAVAGILAGAIFDAVGTYVPAFSVVGAFSILGLICVCMVRRPKHS